VIDHNITQCANRRQPWIVYNMTKVEDAVTANTGVWIMFFAVVILYAAVGTTAILVLRGMNRRFRRGGGFIDLDTPYGPSTLTEVSAKSEEPAG
jgi:cytochrome bd ubiquinol oxidase subunit I